MSNPERGVGRTLAGIFAMSFGICILAAGGLCTVTNLVFLSGTGGLGALLLLLSIAAAVAGFFLIRFARRLLAGPPAIAPAPLADDPLAAGSRDAPGEAPMPDEPPAP